MAITVMNPVGKWMINLLGILLVIESDYTNHKSCRLEQEIAGDGF